MSIVTVIDDDRLTDLTNDLADQMVGGGKSYTAREWATCITAFGLKSLAAGDNKWSHIAEILMVADEVLNEKS